MRQSNRAEMVAARCARAAWLGLLCACALACGVRQSYQQVNTNEPSDYDPNDYVDGPKSGASETPRPKAGETASGERSMNQYDKEATEMVLQRAARSVKGNCGDATDREGKATGPWGELTIEVVLSPTGRSTSVTVPPPYAGTPAAACIENSFTNLRFPPWHGSDTSISWSVELVKPGSAAEEPAGTKSKKKGK